MELWDIAKSTGILEGWLTKESHDFISIFRKWELRFFVLNFTTKTLAYYTDNTYSKQKGCYQLNSDSTVRINYTRNPKKVMLEISGISRGGLQTLYLVSPVLQTIILWYVGVRYVVHGENSKVHEMRHWTDSLRAIINVSIEYN